VAYMFTKGQSGILEHYWVLDPSGNCCNNMVDFAYLVVEVQSGQSVQIDIAGLDYQPESIVEAAKMRLFDNLWAMRVAPRVA
jgi:hypothetical protein